MVRMKWLDKNKNEIIKLYNKGLTQIEITKEFNVSQTAISLRLRKWNISNPDGNRFKHIDIDRHTLKDLYWNKEMHPSQIANIYKCDKMVIYNRMLKYGISRRTKSEARQGKLNSNWKGGACSDRELFNSSPEWKAVSSKVWYRDRKTCQKCKNKYTHYLPPFHVHHIISFADSKDLRLNKDNLILLCKDCHEWVHSNRNTDNLFLEET